MTEPKTIHLPGLQELQAAALRLLDRVGPGDLLQVLDDMPIGLAVLDADRRVRFLSRRLENLVGMPRAEAQGLPCSQVLRAAACMQRCPALAPDQNGSLETDILARNRKRLAVRLTSLRLTDHEGRLAGHVEFFEDVSRLRELEQRAAGSSGAGRMQWRSPQMEKVVRLLPVLGESQAPVLITGETGTGKDLLAESLHAASPRSREPFVRVNLGSMPEVQLESELFGHVAGAFPWAEAPKQGRFQAAAGGTLYLAELSDVPPPLQSNLLRFLDEGVVLPVGPGAAPVRVKARLVAATHQDPAVLVAEGRLRQDLLHRLGALRVHLPPLRQRDGDVEFLLQHFLGIFAGRLRKDLSGFSAKARRILLAYGFPGNVRELMNVVEYAVMVCPGGEVQPAHLPMHVLDSRKARGRRRSGTPEAPGTPDGARP